MMTNIKQNESEIISNMSNNNALKKINVNDIKKVVDSTKTAPIPYVDPYAEYEQVTKTTQVKKTINTNIEKYRQFVKDAMLEGIKKYGVKVENQPIIKRNDKKKISTTTIYNDYCFVEEFTHETKGKLYEFIIPSLYMKGCGDNNIKHVCNEETQRVIKTHSVLGIIKDVEEEEVITSDVLEVE